MNLWHTVIESVIQQPKKYLIAFGGFLFLSLAAMSLLVNDPNPEILPLTHESRVLHESIKQEYSGTKDHVAVLIEASNKDSSIFNSESLTRIESIINDIKNIDVLLDSDYQILKDIEEEINDNNLNVHNEFLAADSKDDKFEVLQDFRESLEDFNNETLIEKLNNFEDHFAPIIKINSLFDTDNIVAKDQSLFLKKAITQVPLEKEKLAILSAEVSENKLFKGLLISEDLRKTGIFIEISLKVEDSKAAFMFYDKLNQIIKDNPGDEKIYIAGTPITTANIAHIIDTDMGKLFPIVLILVIVCLWLKFRIGRGIYIPLIVVIGAIIMTLAIQSLFGIPINVISSTLPVFLISIGIVDGVHIYSEYRDHRVEGLANDDAIRSTLTNLGMPVIATSITTALAFYSLSFTEIVQIKHFGLFVAVGALLAMVLSLIVVPALILVLRDKQVIESKQNSLDAFLNDLLTKLTNVTLDKPWLIVSLAAAIVLMSAAGMTSLSVDNNRVAFFKPDSEIVVGAKAHNEKLSGTETINIVLKSKPNTFKQASNLAFISQLENKFSNHDLVGKITSIADLIERMNKVMTDNQMSAVNWKSINNNLISQYLLMYENSGGDLLSDFVTTDYSQTNIRINVSSNSSNDVKQLVSELNLYFDEHLPSDLSAKIGGSGVVLISAGEEIIYGQLNSFIISIVVVFILLFMVFRSWIYAAVGSAPLVIASAINFGLMGSLGIPLDIGSAIIASIAIGVGVDFSIHYLSRIRNEISQTNNFNTAAINTISRSGNAITSNAFIVGAGFIALMFSDFVPITNIGWIVALTMFSSCVLTLFLTPAILKILDLKNLGIINSNGVSNIKNSAHIVMIGSGYISYFSYIELKKRLANELQNGSVKVTVVSPDDHHVFHGFIGEMITGIVPSEHTFSPNRQIFTGADIVLGKVTHIDTNNKNIQISMKTTNENQTMQYDHLLIGAGAETVCYSIPGMEEFSWTLRERGRVLSFRNHLLESLEKAESQNDSEAIKKTLTVVVAGGGFAGVEMSAAIAEFYQKMKPYYPVLTRINPTIILVHSGEEILPELQEKYGKLVKYAREQLDLANVILKLNVRITKVHSDLAYLSDGTSIEAATILSTLGNVTVIIPGTESFKKDEKHRLITDCYLRADGFDNVWTGGDIASVPHYYSKKPCPTNALWAIKQGKYLARNLARSVQKKPLKPFTYWGLGQAASLGIGKGMAELYTVQLTGWVGYFSRLGFFLYFMPGNRQTFEILLDHIKLPFLDRFMVPVKEKKILGHKNKQDNLINESS